MCNNKVIKWSICQQYCRKKAQSTVDRTPVLYHRQSVWWGNILILDAVDNTSPHKKGKGKGQYSSSWQPHLRATGRHLPYGICHPTQVNAPRLTPGMRASTRFTYPWGMEGWVDLVDLIVPRPGVEPATFRSRVRRRTTAPPRHISRLPLAADKRMHESERLISIRQYATH